jgi:hypothetical protein
MSEHSPATPPNTPTTCSIIPGLLATDDDFKNPTALMWYALFQPYQPPQSQSNTPGFPYPNQYHIGIKNWWQLVGITPEGTATVPCNF